MLLRGVVSRWRGGVRVVVFVGSLVDVLGEFEEVVAQHLFTLSLYCEMLC